MAFREQRRSISPKQSSSGICVVMLFSLIMACYGNYDGNGHKTIPRLVSLYKRAAGRLTSLSISALLKMNESCVCSSALFQKDHKFIEIMINCLRQKVQPGQV